MKENNPKIIQGHQSLQQLMDTLRPFLPKPDMASPKPSYKWKTTDDQNPIVRRADWVKFGID